MTEISCADARGSAAEFALGLLDGVDRAAMVTHLESCASCRSQVEELAATADIVLAGGPTVEPPAGFETRIARAVGQEPTPIPTLIPSLIPTLRPAPTRLSVRRRHPALLWVVAAAAAAVLVLGSGVLIGRLVARRPVDAVRSASMVTPDGRVVGRVAVGADPDTVFVALPGWRAPDDAGRTEPYRLRLTLADGRSQFVGPVHLGPGDGSWGTVLALDARQVRRIALVGETGHAYCTGALA